MTHRKKGKQSRPVSTEKNLEELQKAIEYFGKYPSSLAKAIDVSTQLIYSWKYGKEPISLRCAILIEEKTEGNIKAIDLLPF